MEESRVSLEDFAKLDLRVGRTVRAERLENSEKLIRFEVNFGALGARVILVGLKPWYEPEWFEGKSFVFVYNLEPRRMAGQVSDGMLLCVDSSGGPKPLLASVGAVAGDKVR